MKRELLIKELKRVREELVERGAGNYGMNNGSGLAFDFTTIINSLKSTELFKYTETDITLAEFLGWEEDVEYKYDCNRLDRKSNV